MYSVTIDKRGGFVHAPRNKITAKTASLTLSIFDWELTSHIRDYDACMLRTIH